MDPRVELVVNVNLTKDTPRPLIGVLQYMLGQHQEHPTADQMTDDLFQVSDTWRTMLRSQPRVFDGCGCGRLEWDMDPRGWRFSVRCDCDNTHDEVPLFWAWVVPWITTEGMCGYWRRADEDLVRFLYRDRVFYRFAGSEE